MNSKTYSDFGKASNSAPSDRLGYIGKENDVESGLGDFGVRKYDDAAGRFLSIDPLWEKYLAWSPYHYCGNNPVNGSDPSGMVVQALDDASKDAILLTLSDEEKQYIRFDNDGMIDGNFLNEFNSSSTNYSALRELSNSCTTYFVSSSNGFDYQSPNKQLSSQDFGSIFTDPQWEPGAYSLSTNEIGWQGQTLLPGFSDELNSVDHNAYIYLNSGLSIQGKSEILSHELYGHGLFYELGKNPSHIFNGMSDTNYELKNQIIKSTQETIKNSGVK